MAKVQVSTNRMQRVNMLTTQGMRRMGAASNQVWRQQGQVAASMNRVRRVSGGLNDAMNKGQQNAREFSFELLGLMFAGMALQRAMFGLLRPAFKAAGVFDVIYSSYQSLLTPLIGF